VIILHFIKANRYHLVLRTDGRAVECTGLENRHGFIAHPCVRILYIARSYVDKSMWRYFFNILI